MAGTNGKGTYASEAEAALFISELKKNPKVRDEFVAAMLRGEVGASMTDLVRAKALRERNEYHPTEMDIITGAAYDRRRR